jgi:hypothetical protein
VLVPCYNEACTIQKVINDFRSALPGASIYVYDNNSIDETLVLAERAGAITSKEPRQGKGNVVRRMFSDIDADVYVLVDGDDTYDPSAAPSMIELLLGDRLDMVVGRRIEVEKSAYRPGHRTGNLLLTSVVSWLFGKQFTDILSGYRVFSRRFVKSFPVFAPGFEIETETTVHALSLRMPIREVDTLYRVRPAGSASKLHTYRDGLKIIAMIFNLVRDGRPLLFFTSISALLGLLSVVLAYPIVLEYLSSGLVPRFPTAILATGLAILSALSLASAFVLDAVTRSRVTSAILAYLAIPGPRADVRALSRGTSQAPAFVAPICQTPALQQSRTSVGNATGSASASSNGHDGREPSPLERLRELMQRSIPSLGLFSDRGYGSAKVPTLILATATLLAAGFLVWQHAFVSMWIEGFAEYSPTLLAMLGHGHAPPSCLRIGSLTLPLAFGSYTGCAAIYFDLPAAYAFVHGWTQDPYIFRMGGILLLCLISWVIYATLRQYSSPYTAMWAALIFLSAPNVFLFSLTDRQVFLHMPLTVLLAILCSTLWMKRGTAMWLALAALTWGITLNTRIEALVWPAIAVLLFIVVFRPRHISQQLSGACRRPREVAIAVSAFIVGAAPFILYNFLNSSDNVISYFWKRILPNPTTASQGGFASGFRLRGEQFLSFNLLNTWNMFDLRAANYVAATMFFVAAGVLVLRWFVWRERNLALVVIAVALPLSTLVTGGMRQEHLEIIQPAVAVVIAMGVEAITLRFPNLLRHALFGLIFLSSAWSTSRDWRQWARQPNDQQTMLNQSDPSLLVDRLRTHTEDRILYTNIGFPQYVSYVSRDGIRGEDIMEWSGDEAFSSHVLRALADGSKGRLFVAVGLERDGTAGSLHRTRLLYDLLSAYRVSFKTERLSTVRNRFAYDLIYVEPGVSTPLLQGSARQTMKITSVGPNPIGKNSELMGTIYGSGFAKGDLVRVNSGPVFDTAFGSLTWVTFSVPAGALGEGKTFTLEVIRRDGTDHSGVVRVLIPSR